MGNEKEKHTRKNGKGSDEPVSRSINESQRGTKLSGISGARWCITGVTVIAIVCNCGGCGCREHKRRLDE